MMKMTTTDKNIEETIKKNSYSENREPDEIAKLVLFLSSNVSNYINGQIISIDGGLSESLIEAMQKNGKIRSDILDTAYAAGSSSAHIGGALSLVMC